jgi:hypothetical protein
MKIRRVSSVLVLPAFLAAGAVHARGFTVELGGCSEAIGVAAVPIGDVQPLVPAPYVIAEGPEGFASLVVRASRCASASVDGGAPEELKVAQIGVVLVPPDGTGDINNYALALVTSSPGFQQKLSRAGLPAVLDPDLVYEVTPDPPGDGGELFVDVSPSSAPAWFLSGTVTDPPQGSDFPFVANWWFSGPRGQMKMATSIPLLGYGSGSIQAFTRRDSLLGSLLAGNVASFGVNLRGVFDSAELEATVTP